MTHKTLEFRARYRAGIPRWYSPWAHGGFVLAYGLACLVMLGRSLHDVRPLEWLVVPMALVLFNLAEYSVHKNLGHFKRRFSALFYKRHTGDHHSFFVEGMMAHETRQDWRVIFFPPWLIVVFSVGAAAAWLLLSPLNQNAATLFAQSLIGSYLGYEILHACEHLPQTHWVARLPWIGQMHRLHELHHRRDLMHERNFNIVFPLTDWLSGTLHWEPRETPIDLNKATLMRHEVDIDGHPQEVLAYARTATRWPEWHPSSLRVSGPSGPLDVNSRFEEDIHAGGKAGHLRWQVTQCEPSSHWQARAWGQHGLKLVVTYTVTPCAQGTRFVRTLHYQLPAVLKLLDVLVLRKKIESESVLSMVQLREACMASVPPAGNG